MQSPTDETDSIFLTVLYMVLFYFIFSFVEFILIFLLVVQVAMSILAGEPNAKLQRFGSQLSVYVGQIVNYIAMQSSHKPYPFSDWPPASDTEKKAD